MANISEEIVSINNVISNQSQTLIENLLDMDENAKKFILLKKDIYRDYFEVAQKAFDSSLASINHLSARGYTAPAVFSLFLDKYTLHNAIMIKEQIQKPEIIVWVDEDTLNSWLALLIQFRDLNQNDIEKSLMYIHSLTQESTRDGLLGFGLSVFTSFFGVWFISKSILSPLKQLTLGLRTLSSGNYNTKITVPAADEFHDLAIAYNEMNGELQEQENLRADFIASLSHELRTPLSSIQESVNMLTEEVFGKVNEKQHKFLTIAGNELTRITDLLNHLMDVSLLESHEHINGNHQTVEPTQLVVNCISAVSGAAHQKNITIRENFQPNCGYIHGQPEKLQQVFINILGNAIKFSPQKSEIRISVLKSRHSEYVTFNIVDEGPGIPENEKTMIFNKYYRSKSVRKHMNGVGLGLYISKTIVHNMGGSIRVVNNPAKGCTFSLDLPAV
jgi:signal transduction histidine kinase